MEKQKCVTCILLILINGILFAQTIQQKIQLDTILYTSYQLENTWENIPSCIADDKLWFNIPNWREGDDSVMVVRYELNTYKNDTLFGIIPDISEKIKTPVPLALAADKNYCVILFFKTIAIFELHGKKLIFNKIFPINERFTYIKLQQDLLICGKTYDVNPMDESTKTSLAVYDIRKDKFIRFTNPEFKNIEFSHFNGYHWIDASESKILFAQTTEYKIDIYNQKLEKQSEIKRYVPAWNQFDSKIMERFTKEIPAQYPKVLIDSLSPYEDVVSRIEGAYFIDDSTILVKYIPTDNLKKGRERMYDIWVYKNNAWQLKFSDLQENKYALSEFISKKNMPITAGASIDIYTMRNRLALIMPGATIYPFGKTGNEYKKMEDNYYISNNPVAKIYIFSILK